MNVVKTVNLSKSYGKDNAKVNALHSTNLEISQGEFTAIVGTSGSGKSTLLHLLGGLETPTTGDVFIDGQNLYSLKENDLAIFRRRKLGFIFQQFNLIPVLTVEENITLPLLLDNKKVDKTYIQDLIHFLGLENRKNHLPNALSGGQQQRVAIARALVAKPSIIFADEPTGNLDTKSSTEVLTLLRESITRYHQTLILITHNKEISYHADRIITIEDGRMIGDEVARG
ncbi:ABC transporter ATP-binding protein [Bacillus sp. CGMCC 1.16607]|uniref:ABC transporter ATP-binding protein n=1 Tax=Bacillus sp. CGMCC 1.16607 TaxID=3351842 RepID=UPI0036458065